MNGFGPVPADYRFYTQETITANGIDKRLAALRLDREVTELKGMYPMDKYRLTPASDVEYDVGDESEVRVLRTFDVWVKES